jgi:hypothetical protein
MNGLIYSLVLSSMSQRVDVKVHASFDQSFRV